MSIATNNAGANHSIATPSIPAPKEGTITKEIEKVTSRVSSGTYLSFAFGSIAISAFLQSIGRKADAQFVGQWVPTILLMGLYNKLVKLQGSDKTGTGVSASSFTH